MVSTQRSGVSRPQKVMGTFGITQFYPDDWGAYQRQLEPVGPPVGQTRTQTSQRPPLTQRIRIKRLAIK